MFLYIECYTENDNFEKEITSKLIWNDIQYIAINEDSHTLTINTNHGKFSIFGDNVKIKIEGGGTE